jgi:U3 small nucleolar RNA-associated protein 20
MHAERRFHLGQLKVNFRPLYSDTLEVLGEIGKRYPEILWSIAMAEINKCHAGELASLISVPKPDWATEDGEAEASASTEAKLDKSFLCPNANKLYQATNRELSMQATKSTDVEAIDVCSQTAVTEVRSAHFCYDDINIRTRLTMLG